MARLKCTKPTHVVPICPKSEREYREYEKRNIPGELGDFKNPSAACDFHSQYKCLRYKMKPINYLRLIYSSDLDADNWSRRVPRDEFASKMVKRLRDRYRSCKPIDPLQLDLEKDDKTGKWKTVGHEGRHRAYAAMLEGVDKIHACVSFDRQRFRGKRYFNHEEMKKGEDGDFRMVLVKDGYPPKRLEPSKIKPQFKAGLR